MSAGTCRRSPHCSTGGRWRGGGGDKGGAVLRPGPAGRASKIAEVGATEAVNTRPAVHGVPPSVVKKAISEDPSLAPVFKDSPSLRVAPQSLAALCANLVVKHEVAYHDLGLPDEVVEAIEKKDKAAMMRRLLGRIDAILASSMKAPLKLKPATDEEIAAAEKKFQLKFPPELSALLKWSNGVPMDAPGMMAFVQCAGLEEINEEFFYNEDFPTLFRKMKWIPIAPIDYDFCYNALDIKSGMVVQIDNECGSSLLITPSLIESVRAYADALEQHKDNVEALNSYAAPEEEDGSMHLSIQAPEIYTRFAVVTHRVYGGSDDEEDEDGSEDDDDDEDAEEDDGLNMRRLKEHKMTELRAFAKKHNIRVFGRMKDDVINAITIWRRNRKREARANKSAAAV